MTKRTKINFETINKGKYEFIPWNRLYKTNKRIKEIISKLRRKFNL
jgi:hypothetical protein